MSTEEAMAYGRAADAEGLEKIIRLGDPAMVNAFNNGMSGAQIRSLPPKIEGLVVAHFDNRLVGAALRELSPRYQTRRLFDLHYARIKAAFRNDDPSFTQVLNTDLTGIENQLLQVVDKFEQPAQRGFYADGRPAKTSRPSNRALLFLGARAMPEAVPLLIAELENIDVANLAEFNLLMEYPSLEVWQKTRAEIDRLHQAGKISDARYAEVRPVLDKRLADSGKAFFAERKKKEDSAAYNKQLADLHVDVARIDSLKKTDPGRYAAEYGAFLEKRAAMAAAYPERVDYSLDEDSYHLAILLRFRLSRPADAVGFYAMAAQYGNWWAKVAEADTYQLELHNKTGAIQRYRQALDRLPRPGATRPNNGEYYPLGFKNTAWLRAWLLQEIHYLETGEVFNGRIGEQELSEFFSIVHGYSYAEVIGEFEQRPDIAEKLPFSCTGTGGDEFVREHCGYALSEFTELEERLAQANRAELAQLLDRLPPSHFTLLVTLHPLTALPDADSILRYLRKHDPSGYWSTCLLGTIYYLNQYGGNEALRAQLIPGDAAKAKSQPISVAASKFLQERGMRIATKASSAR